MRVYNSIAIDGTVFVGWDGRVVWSWYLPEWVVRAYNAVF